MKNRLSLAKHLLTPDGVIFVICDEIEEAYLKVMGNNVFGRNNYIGDLIWQKRKGGGNDSRFLALDHDYILCWVKDISLQTERWRAPYDENYLKRYKEISEDGRRYYWDTVSRDGLQAPILVSLTCPDGSILTINSQKSKETIEHELENGDMRLTKGIKGWALHHRVYLPEAGKVQRSILTESGTNKTAKDEIEVLFSDAKAFEHAKPEELIHDLVILVTQPADVILDFFLGSGTTAAVAHKMGRRYIGVEQMDYINTVTVPRLQKVIEGEQGGISKGANWQGGGSFIYCELMEQNESIASALQAASTSEEVQAILNRVTNNGLIIPSVLPDDLRTHMNEFALMPLEQQKKLVMELLDKNKLYVNLCDMEDEELAVSDRDKAFTKSFYRMEKEGGM
jgi:adenine-specific DNA-methyltransferase